MSNQDVSDKKEYPQWMYHADHPEGKIFQFSLDEKIRNDEVNDMENDGWFCTPKAMREGRKPQSPPTSDDTAKKSTKKKVNGDSSNPH